MIILTHACALAIGAFIGMGITAAFFDRNVIRRETDAEIQAAIDNRKGMW